MTVHTYLVCIQTSASEGVARYYEGCSINVLQNGAILLTLKCFVANVI